MIRHDGGFPNDSRGILSGSPAWHCLGGGAAETDKLANTSPQIIV